MIFPQWISKTNQFWVNTPCILFSYLTVISTRRVWLTSSFGISFRLQLFFIFHRHIRIKLLLNHSMLLESSSLFYLHLNLHIDNAYLKMFVLWCYETSWNSIFFSFLKSSQYESSKNDNFAPKLWAIATSSTHV